MVGSCHVIRLGGQSIIIFWYCHISEANVQGSGLSVAVTLVELIFAFIGVGGIEISELLTDPLAKWTGRALDQNGGAIFKKVAEGYAIFQCI